MTSAPSPGVPANAGCCDKRGYMLAGPQSLDCICAPGWTGSPGLGQSCVDLSQLHGCTESFPVEYIAASVGGGVVFLCIGFFLLWKCCPRRKHEQDREKLRSNQNSHSPNVSLSMPPSARQSELQQLSVKIQDSPEGVRAPSTPSHGAGHARTWSNAPPTPSSKVIGSLGLQPRQSIDVPKHEHLRSSIDDNSRPRNPSAEAPGRSDVVGPGESQIRRRESMDVERTVIRAQELEPGRRHNSLDMDYKLSLARRKGSLDFQPHGRTPSMDIGSPRMSKTVSFSSSDQHSRGGSAEQHSHGRKDSADVESYRHVKHSSTASSFVEADDVVLASPANPTKFSNEKNEYHVLRVLGQGHFGKAYLVWNEKMGKLLVLKAQWCPTDTKRNESFREATTLSRFGGANLLKFLDLFIQGQYVCIVMNYCSGGSLADEVAKENSVPEVARLLKELCSGLLVLHSQDHVHRDIKPDNIFLSDPETRTVIIGDLGMARALNENGFYASTFGHALYKAPEIHQSKFSPRSDMWAVGCVALELLSHQTLIELYKKGVVLGQLSSEELVSVIHNLLGKYVGDPIFDLVRHLLVVDPNQRLSAREVVEWTGDRITMPLEG